jgi:hypothetical protein
VVACEAQTPARETRGDKTERADVVTDTNNAQGSSLVDSAAEPMPALSVGGTRGAEEIVRAYYAAINARQYQRAYALWNDDGPPGRPTLQAFSSGFAGTDSVQVTLGAPGRMEGAAGSRYVRIPVRVRAFEHGNGPREFTGSYTLRRSVVPGSSAADQLWHLYAADLH